VAATGVYPRCGVE